MRRTRQNWAQRVRPKPQLRQTSREAQLGQAPNTKPTHHRPQTPPSPSGRPEKTQLRQAPNTKPSRGRIGRAEGAAGLVAYRPFVSSFCLQRQAQLLELLAHGLELDRDKRTQSRETQPEHGLEELLHFNLHFVCLSQAYAAAPLPATKARSVYA